MEHNHDIAITGMAGRFPNSNGIEEFWKNIRQGIRCISSLDGVPASNIINARGVLADIDLFDAGFFSIPPAEAEILDPQHRLFLETVWHALEDAGVNPVKTEQIISVYAACAPSSYQIFDAVDSSSVVSKYLLMIANSPDFLATRVSYKLNLSGESMVVQTGCSSSLVAVHMACQSLLSGQSQIAIAGGVTIEARQDSGYLYEEGMIASPDGHCRVFDKRAGGTVPGSGVGAVVLRNLADAVADGDHIYAVIKGSAINNDGSSKAGFMAPSVQGQAEVIATALSVAGVSAETIGYVEAHGTATPIGDPIELEALTKAFGLDTDHKSFCAIGSLKANFGHLDRAAGIAGLIKAAMCVKHGFIPPAVDFTEPNPEINFDLTPFFVPVRQMTWKSDELPRRAGVSSFGVGGTNAHLILEEYQTKADPSGNKSPSIITISAQSIPALNTMSENLADYIDSSPAVDLEKIAVSRNFGRAEFTYRRAVAATERLDAIKQLREPVNPPPTQDSPQVVFMFPGMGQSHLNGVADLYRTQPVFNEAIDSCARLLLPHIGLDIRQALLRSADNGALDPILHKVAYLQPALFIVEFALSQLWMSWGVKPDAMIGHSLGEYVAACVSGVFSLQDALAIIAERSRLMQQCTGGSMLSVAMSEKELLARIDGHLSIAAINGDDTCVVSGASAKIESLESSLVAEGVQTKRLFIEHAAHSPMLDPIREEFTKIVAGYYLNPPTIPFISNVTGDWIDEGDAVDSQYWGRHLRETVRFASGLDTLFSAGCRTFIEIGPSQTLTRLTELYLSNYKTVVIPTLSGYSPQKISGDVSALTALGDAWCSGVEVNWEAVHQEPRQPKIPLPPYPFERRRFWLAESEKTAAAPLSRLADTGGWLYRPVWNRTETGDADNLSSIAKLEGRRWLIISDEVGVGSALAERLRRINGSSAVVEIPAAAAEELSPGSVCLRQGETFNRLSINDLVESGWEPTDVVNLRHVSHSSNHAAAGSIMDSYESYFGKSLSIIQTLTGYEFADSLCFWSVSTDLHPVCQGDKTDAAKSSLIGLHRVCPLEYPEFKWRSVDFSLNDSPPARIVEQLLNEFCLPAPMLEAAYRKDGRWVLEHASAWSSLKPRPLRENGTYLITGGLGHIGLLLAETIAEEVNANLILVSRTKVSVDSDPTSGYLEDDGSKQGARVKKYVRRLKELGSKVEIHSADATDETEMHRLLEDIYDRYGTINGVIHAAGFVDNNRFPFLQQADRRQLREISLAKVLGTRILAEAFKDRELDFMLLCSSLSTTIGGLRFGTYISANAFEDATAARHFAEGNTNWTSIAWDAWQFDEANAEQKIASLENLAIRPEEGKEVFRRILTIREPNVIVSTADLKKRIASIKNYLTNEKLEKIAPEAVRRPTEAPLLSDDVSDIVFSIVASTLGTAIDDQHRKFVDLGADSLMIMRIISRLKSALGINLSIARAFEAVTLARLVELCRQLKKQKTANNPNGDSLRLPSQTRNHDSADRKSFSDSESSLEQHKNTDNAPLSSAQERLWFLAQLEPDNPFYNVPLAWKISGAFQPGEISSAVETLIARHGSLRSKITTRDGEGWQSINAEMPEVRFIDLGTSDPNAARLHVVEAAVRDASAPFDLEHGPIVRPQVIRTGSGEHYVLLTMHHIVVDAWSVAILENELSEILSALRTGQTAALPELTTTYCDYAWWETQRLKLPELKQQEQYWLQRLSDLQELRLPADKPLSSSPFGPGGSLTIHLKRELIDDLRIMGNEEHSTLYVAIVASVMTLLHCWTGCEEVVIGTNIANRRDSEFENVVGFFVNALVLRQNFSRILTLKDALERVRATVFEAFDNQDLPYVKLVQLLNPPRKLNRSPVFSVMFTFFDKLPGNSDDKNHPSQTVQIVERVSLVKQGPVKFDLSINVEADQGGLKIIFVYAEDIFEQQTIENLAADLKTLLAEMTADRQQSISKFTPTVNKIRHPADIQSTRKAKFEKLRGTNRSRD